VPPRCRFHAIAQHEIGGGEVGGGDGNDGSLGSVAALERDESRMRVAVLLARRGQAPGQAPQRASAQVIERKIRLPVPVVIGPALARTRQMRPKNAAARIESLPNAATRRSAASSLRTGPDALVRQTVDHRRHQHPTPRSSATEAGPALLTAVLPPYVFPHPD
jgi:hypothetical protein